MRDPRYDDFGNPIDDKKPELDPVVERVIDAERRAAAAEAHIETLLRESRDYKSRYEECREERDEWKEKAERHESRTWELREELESSEMRVERYKSKVARLSKGKKK